jgi:glycosyltransferase involved in cell wall biosynthesis
MEEQGVSTDLIFNKFYKLSVKYTSKKNIFIKSIKALGLVFSVLLNIRKTTKCDVIFAHAILFPTYYSVLLQGIHRKPVVCYVHGGDLNAYMNKKGFLKKALVYSLKKANQIICNSQDIEKKVLSLGIDDRKVHVVSPGVDLNIMNNLQERTTLKSKLGLSDKFVLLSIGNAIHRKGHDILLKSILSFKREHKDIPVHLMLVTQGKEVFNYQQFIDQHELKEMVTLQPYMDQKDLVELYNSSDLFVFPSREEPLGLAAIEAMACGLRVVGANVGGIKEALSNGAGLLFESENTTDLTAKIELIYLNKHNEKQMQAAMKNQVAKYSLHENVQSMINIMKD